MGKDRKVLFVTTTPVPGFERVTAYEDSWVCHIADKHADMVGKEGLVQKVLSEPVYVYSGTGAGNFVFLDPAVCNARGFPLVVLANQPEGVLRTAYFNAGLRNFGEHKISQDASILLKPGSSK